MGGVSAVRPLDSADVFSTRREFLCRSLRFTATAAALVALGFAAFNAPPKAQAQEKAQEKPRSRPRKKPSGRRSQTTKVEGTDNVYIFRNGNHQAMFVVTKDGVIATDPVAYGRPTGGADYIAEIRKVTQAPIRYLIYSHHHFDHIAGGKAFKDAGAQIIAHKNAKKRLAAVKDPHTPMPDRYVGDRTTLNLGGTALELLYLGPNHSDTTLVMRLPREKIIFVVDTIPVGSVPGRGMIDFFPLETETFMKRVIALDWERLIPGHPGAPNDRLGTKKDAEDILKLYQAASAGIQSSARTAMLGAGREGIQARRLRELAGLCQRPALHRAPLLRPVGPRHLTQQQTRSLSRLHDLYPPLVPATPPPLHRSYGGFESAEAHSGKRGPRATKEVFGFPLMRE